MQVGEVIGGSLSNLHIEIKASEEEWPISFGAFIKISVKGYDVVGIVTDIGYEFEYGKPRPRWVEEPEILEKLYPDFPEKFRNVTEVFVLGTMGGGGFVSQTLPPSPPPLHSPVALMPDEDVKRFHCIGFGTGFRLDYVYRIVTELKMGRCLDLLKAIVDRLEKFKIERNVVVGEINSIYMALGQENLIPLISSILSRRE